MNISIVVHSKTGNTLLVANSLSERLKSEGHTVSLANITAENDGEANVDAIVLTNAPQVAEYDLLILGAPVRGGRLSPVMQAYLRQFKLIPGKPIYGFVTQFFQVQNWVVIKPSNVCQKYAVPRGTSLAPRV